MFYSFNHPMEALCSLWRGCAVPMGQNNSDIVYRPEIDGLRAIAVLSVLFYHAGFSGFSGGFVGVDIFFVISGFLITSIIYKDVSAGRFSFLEFYDRRVRRIAPALVFVLIVSAVVAFFILTPDELVTFSNGVIWTILLSANIFFWNTIDYFSPDTHNNPLIHMWSLSVEEQFYIVFPIIIILLFRLSKKSLLPLTLIGAVLSFVLADWASTQFPKAAFYLLPTRAWELMIGAALAMTPRRLTDEVAFPVAQLLSMIGLLAIVAPVAMFDDLTPFPGRYALAPTLGSALVIAFARPGTATHHVLSWRVAVWFGLISYSLYLWHQPIFAFHRLSSPTDPEILEMALLIALSVAAAWASWRFVERPFRNRALMSRRVVMTGAAVSAAVLLTAGMLGRVTDGMPNRVPQETLARTALFDELHQERLAFIRSGECHFNQRGRHAAIGPFLEHWDCRASDADPGDGPEIIVVGDSVAGDLAAALRASGLSVTQMTGSACSIAPEFMAPHCRAMFDRVKALAPRPEGEILILSNKFQRAELQEDAIASIAQYWSDRFDRIYVATPGPEYPGLRERHIRAAWRSASTTSTTACAPVSQRAFDEFMRRAQHFSSNKIDVLDTYSVLEKAGVTCGYLGGSDKLLYIDAVHWTRAGDEMYGALIAGQHGELLTGAR